MRLIYHTKNKRFSAELDVQNHKDAVKQLHAFQEIFEESCGKCKSDDIKYTTRKASDGKKEYLYHELRCNKCGAKLALGALDDGSDNLFPKRKDDEGKYKGSNGWCLWNKEKGVEE
jgi:uncharacterized low-complexity protein